MIRVKLDMGGLSIPSSGNVDSEVLQINRVASVRLNWKASANVPVVKVMISKDGGVFAEKLTLRNSAPAKLGVIDVFRSKVGSPDIWAVKLNFSDIYVGGQTVVCDAQVHEADAPEAGNAPTPEDLT